MFTEEALSTVFISLLLCGKVPSEAVTISHRLTLAARIYKPPKSFS